MSRSSSSGAAGSAETPWQALEAGRDPISTQGRQVTLPRCKSFDDSVSFDDAERRCYLLAEPEHLGSCFLPAALTRESGNRLLPSWEWMRLLPPEFYVIVFALSATPGTYRGGCRALT